MGSKGIRGVGPWTDPGQGPIFGSRKRGLGYMPLKGSPQVGHQGCAGTVQLPASDVQANLDVCTGRDLDVRTGERLYEWLMCVVETYAILITSTLRIFAPGRSRFARLPEGSGRAKRQLAGLTVPDSFSLGRAEIRERKVPGGGEHTYAHPRR